MPSSPDPLPTAAPTHHRRRRRLAGLAVLALLGWVAWSGWTSTGAAGEAHAQATPGADGRPAHHGPDGFRNRYGQDVEKGLGEVLRWRLSRSTPPLPDPPLPAAEPRFDLPPPQLTWLGHASMLVRLPGLTLLTDPHFSERASPFSFAGPKRAYPLPFDPAKLPRVDAVLISHNHYDHLDVPTVRQLVAQAGGPPRFVVPLGLKAWFEDLKLEPAPVVQELDWWQSLRLGDTEVVFTPAHHWSSRTPWDRRRTLWGGFAVFVPGGPQLIYTGDTGYSPDFADIRRHFEARGPFDLALIPVGCYEPRDFMRNQHVDPAEALKIHQDLGARRSIGVHWGTFEDLCDEPLDQAPRDLAAALKAAGLPAERFTVMRRGETRPIVRGD